MELQKLMYRIHTKTATEEDYKYYVDNLMNEAEKEIGKPVYEMDRDESLQYQALTYNASEGNLKGYNCPKCKNRGDFEFVRFKNGEPYVYRDFCSCWSIRDAIRRMEASGLGNLLSLYAFKNYKCNEQWQKDIFDKAQAFVKSNDSGFFIGGASGSGKTMICTGIVRELIKQGLDVKYMLWNDEALELKQNIMAENSRYSDRMETLKNIQVLYIDDFFKTQRDASVSNADIKLAFEILNFRYNKARTDTSKRYVTIISSEKDLREILTIDEALGGRIYEMATAKNYIYIPNDGKRNYRLNDLYSK